MRRNAREHVSFPFRTILFFLSSTSTDEMKFEKRVSRFIICIYIYILDIYLIYSTRFPRVVRLIPARLSRKRVVLEFEKWTRVGVRGS